MKVLVWNENYHERNNKQVAELYPEGLHGQIASFLRCDDIEVRTATLYDENCGITDEILEDTDVLVWWGHMRHLDVPDEIVEKIYNKVLAGMGLVALHSAHHSKIFKKLMGTTCNLKWREGARERVWTIKPNHPIAEGIDETFALDSEEMYGEMFDIPNPEDIIFLGWFEGGEVFRSGCTWTRGHGKIFYFQPGHEENPSFYNPNVQRIIQNGVRWACPIRKNIPLVCPHTKPFEKV